MLYRIIRYKEGELPIITLINELRINFFIIDKISHFVSNRTLRHIPIVKAATEHMFSDMQGVAKTLESNIYLKPLTSMMISKIVLKGQSMHQNATNFARIFDLRHVELTLINPQLLIGIIILLTNKVIVQLEELKTELVKQTELCGHSPMLTNAILYFSARYIVSKNRMTILGSFVHRLQSFRVIYETVEEMYVEVDLETRAKRRPNYLSNLPIRR